MGSLFNLAYLFGGGELHQKYVQAYKSKTIRYSEMKNEISQAIFQELQPFQERRREFENNPELVEKILEEHTKKCREKAQQTLKEVKEKMGLL